MSEVVEATVSRPRNSGLIRRMVRRFTQARKPHMNNQEGEESTSRSRQDCHLDECVPVCPQLPLPPRFGVDPAVAYSFPPSLARRLRVLPVAARSGSLVLCCERQLTDREKSGIRFITRCENVTFVCDPREFPDVRLHFEELLDYVYPRERSVICSPPGPIG